MVLPSRTYRLTELGARCGAGGGALLPLAQLTLVGSAARRGAHRRRRTLAPRARGGRGRRLRLLRVRSQGGGGVLQIRE